MDAAIDNLKPERLVNALRQGVVYPGIGCHFDAAVPPRPVLCCRQQQCAYTFFAMAFRYEPALHETDGMLRIEGAHGMRTR